MVKLNDPIIQNIINAGYEDARYYSSKVKEMLEIYKDHPDNRGILILAMKTAARILKLTIDTYFVRVKLFDDNYMAIVKYNTIIKDYYNMIANHIMEVYYKS